MFLIEYWVVIGYTNLLRRWRKALKIKRLREEEENLRQTMEKLLRRRRENEALKGDLRHDLPQPYPALQPVEDRQPQGNLESEGGH